jgi:two-component system, chemotaxis family, chemotaxis protein CheY
MPQVNDSAAARTAAFNNCILACGDAEQRAARVMLNPHNTTFNIAALAFLVADPNAHSSAITHGILRGLGANRVVEVRNARDAIQVLLDQKIDLMLCELNLPTSGGLNFIRSLRQNPNNPCRTLPIVITTGDTRTSTIKAARDSGANMVIAKPMSPATLYERVVWVAFHPRNFVDAVKYFGPDRRFKIEGLPDNGGRRTGDGEVAIAADEGPALSQNEIDSLLQEARTGGA